MNKKPNIKHQTKILKALIKNNGFCGTLQCIKCPFNNTSLYETHCGRGEKANTFRLNYAKEKFLEMTFEEKVLR